MFRIQINNSVKKDIKSIPRHEIDKIFRRIERLKTNPFPQGKNPKPLTPSNLGYRLRVGDYRVLYEVENEEVRIYRIRHRKNSYSV